MNDIPSESRALHATFSEVIGELRPRLHRYAARMVGSAIDGDDVVQASIVKALRAEPDLGSGVALERWLIRVTHNTAIDFLRARARQAANHAAEEADAMPDHSSRSDAGFAVRMSLQTFMRLPALQRSTVVLKDVLGYSLDEVANFTDRTVPAVKSALQRGRARLRELAAETVEAPPLDLDAHELRLLEGYVERFNARDFDAIRGMLSDEVRLDLVNRLRAEGRATVSNYFSNYEAAMGWHFAVGLVDGRPALLVFDPDDLDGPPLYFALLVWADDRILSIRDFRYARYVLEAAHVERL